MNELVTPLTSQDKFKQLVEGWRKDTWHLSNLNMIIEHPSYQDIIKMGEEALPLIFEDFKENGNHWFAALKEITRKDVAEGAVTHKQGQHMWLDWAERNGYLPDTEKFTPKFFNVDGIGLSICGDVVEGVGWQGTHFRFILGEEELILEVVREAVLFKRAREIWLSQSRNRGKIKFEIERSNGWIQAVDWMDLRHLAFSANSDEAIIHVIGQFKRMHINERSTKHHFCKRWGVKDDD